MPNWKPWTREELAAKAASDIPEGWSVNLGIGIPTLIGNYIPPDREVILHSENGIVGMGPAPAPEKLNPWLVNASRQHVTLVTGASLMNHADSFGMVRGGHLDLCVLGGFQVAENGDLANWSRSANDRAPAIGGAMDLAVGAKRIWVLMEHTTKSGTPKILERCTLPITGLRVVDTIITELAVIRVTPGGLVLEETAPGVSAEEVQRVTVPKLARIS